VNEWRLHGLMISAIHINENLLMDQSNFNQCIMFPMVPELITREYSKPALLLRHDVDLDLNKALGNGFAWKIS